MRGKHRTRRHVLVALGALAVTIVSSAGISQADSLGGSKSVGLTSVGGAPITLLNTTGTGVSVPAFHLQLDNDYPLPDRDVSARSVENLKIVLDPLPTPIATFRLASPSGLNPCARSARINRAISAYAGTSADTKVSVSWVSSDASGDSVRKRHHYQRMSLEAPVPGANTPTLRVCIR